MCGRRARRAARRARPRRSQAAADRSSSGADAAIDMQAVLDGEILEVAEPGVDAAQRLVRRVGLRRRRPRAARPVLAAVSTISFASRSRRRRSSPSAWAYSSTSRSSFCLFFVQARSGHRRRQMAERHRRDAALGLRRFARIADDERIDDGQRAGDDLGKTVFAQRDRLAGQPFQRAMRADMDQARGSRAFCAATGRRRSVHGAAARWVVVVGAAVGGASAIGGERHGDVAEGRGAEGEVRHDPPPP